MNVSFLNKGPRNYCRFRQIFKDLGQKISNDLKLESFYQVDVTILGQEEMAHLNNEFRQINEPTDVLSFPFLSKEEIKNLKESKHPVSLGEIIICHEVAKKQAENNKTPLTHEMRLLFVHGFLHLLGYDHGNNKEHEEMFSLQEKLLKKES